MYGTTSLGLDITESFGGGTVGATAAFSPNLTAGTEVALGTFGASGKLPVDIPKYVPKSGVYSTDENVYELGYGIEYDAIAKDPDKKGLADAIAQAKAIDKSVYTTESWEAAAEALNTLKVVLQTAENVNLTHKLAQSVVDENETDLRSFLREEVWDVIDKNIEESLKKTTIKHMKEEFNKQDDSNFCAGL